MKRNCDVLVIGAGMAGLTCALELPADLSVILLSKIPMPTGSTSHLVLSSSTVSNSLYSGKCLRNPGSALNQASRW